MRVNTVRRVTGVLALALTASLAPVAVSTPADAASTLNVMTWNMCDSRRPTWHCEGTGTSRQKIDVVRYHVAENGVRGVLLQEVCEDSLATLLGDLGSAWQARFVTYRWAENGVLTDSPCGITVDGNRIGTAIVVRAGLSGAQSYETTQPWTGLNRPFHCATATYWQVRLCNAHLTPAGGNPDQPTWEYADDQLADIRDIAAGFPRLVLGGDFNVNPPDWPGNARAWLWDDANPYDDYAECDRTGAVQTGRATHDGGWKLDYLFTNRPHRWCALGASAYSDHHVLIQSVTA